MPDSNNELKIIEQLGFRWDGEKWVSQLGITLKGGTADVLSEAVAELIKQREQAGVEKYREGLVKSFEANLLDGDKVQAGQMIASTEVKSWLSALEQGETE